MSGGRRLSIKKSVFIGLPLLLLILVSSASIWLLTSSSGAAWLWHTLEDVAGGALQSGQVEGDLASGFVIHGLQYQSQDLDIAISRTEVQVRPGVWPLSVQVEKLLLQDVSIVRRTSPNPLQNSAGNTDPGLLIEAIKLPLVLEAHHVELSNIVFQETDAKALLLAESITFKMTLYERMEIKQLEFSSDLVEATAQGYLGLEPPFDLMVSLDGRYEVATAQDAKLSSIPISLKGDGDFDKLRFELKSRRIDLDVSGELFKPLTAFAWDITAAMQQLPYTAELDGRELAVTGLSLTSKGVTESWSADMTADLDIEDQQAATLVISATGSESGIYISHSTVKGEGVDLGFGGQLDWSPRLAGELHAVIAQLDFTPWMQQWPESAYLTGELDLGWSADGLKIPKGRLSVSGTELVLDFKADIDIAENRIETQLGWKNLSWPLNTTTPVFKSPSGLLEINGEIDQWKTSGLLELALGEYPQGRFQIQGGGDRHSAHIELLDGEVLGGRLNGVADANWEDGLKWSAGLLAKGVDPEPIIPGWPGRLDVGLGVKADSRAEHLQVRIDSLQGMLRGTRISAQGGLEFVGENINFDHLELRTDEAVLQLNGKAMEPAGVSASFSGHLPSMLLQGASGSVDVDGRFSGHIGQPVFEMQMQALDLAWKGLAIKTLAVTTGEIAPGGLIPALDVKATELVWKNEQVDEISLLLRPDGAGYTLQTSLASELLDLSAILDIKPENPEDVLRSPWSGVITDLNLAINEKYNFNLAEPAPFAWSADSFLLESSCLQEAGGASLCLGIDHIAGSSLSLLADVTALPLDYIADYFEFDVKFEQMLEGRLQWHQLKDKMPTGGAEMRITAGRILDLNDNEPLIESNEGVIGFVLRDGNLESGVVDVVFPGVGFIDIEFGVLDIAQDGRKTLKGRAVSELNDLKELGQLFLPGVDNLGGRFVANIDLGGSVADPALEGDFELTNGSIYYAPIGLKLDDIAFAGRVESRDQGSLNGQFKAGEGIGSIDGRFKFEDFDHFEMNLGFSGDQLLVVNTDSLNLLTEAELEIGLSPRRMDINGRIRVPSARFTPQNMLLEKVSDSEDLIVETRGTQETATGQDKPLQNQVFGNLEVSFGEDVNIKIPGIDASLSGSVAYHWSGDPVPVAEGSYVLNGSVDIYGPTLNITNGSINFPVVPANNPVLNIRAQRSIFGNTQIRTAGVQVIGTLKRPVLEAFTVPVTSEDRAWSLLVTGSDFDQGQGVGGFDVGTYIAPRLYVSYGISLFEDENVVSARYDLKKGFGIKVTSGQRETGLDVSYTIDR